MPRKRSLPPLEPIQAARAEKFLRTTEGYRASEVEFRIELEKHEKWSEEFKTLMGEHMGEREKTMEKLLGLTAQPSGVDDDSLVARRKRCVEAALKFEQLSDRTAEEVLRRREVRNQKKANLEGSKNPQVKAPVKKLAAVWDRLMREHFPDIRYSPWWVPDASGKPKPQAEAGKAGQFVRGYGLDLASATLVYVFTNWAKLGARFKARPEVPTVGWVVSLASVFTAEVQLTKPGAQSAEQKVQAAKAALDKWFADHPSESLPPDDLRKALIAAQNELEALKGGKR